MLPQITIPLLKEQASAFAAIVSSHDEALLFGVTDGKAIGTYLEHKFRKHIEQSFSYVAGSSAKGIDFPELEVDLKTTSISQPQSSCPFRSARQKIYGLGYHLLVFVYDKSDNHKNQTGRLKILHSIFVERTKTGDFQTTSGLRKIIENQGNRDDILAFLQDRMLPADDIGANALADEILRSPPEIGYLTISNALQWRLQYSRVIQQAGSIDGIERL